MVQLLLTLTHSVPVEWFSLLIDVPWITLFNDLRQGLLTLVIMIFWTLIINNHDVQVNNTAIIVVIIIIIVVVIIIIIIINRTVVYSQ